MIHVPGQYSGGKAAQYEWTQTKGEVEVRVSLPDGVADGSVKCDIKPRSFSLSADGAEAAALSGELTAVVVVGDSLWSIERDGAKAVAVLSFRKAVPDLWTRLLATDEEPATPPRLLDGLQRKAPSDRQELLRQVCLAR